jgi:hypothetical protein
MICFGVVNAICSIIFGSIMKYIGRIPIIIFGTVVHGCIFAYLLFWRPHPSNPLVFFLISGLWGVADAVWQTQINGIYGALFRRNKEAAFSNYRLWESLGVNFTDFMLNSLIILLIHLVRDRLCLFNRNLCSNEVVHSYCCTSPWCIRLDHR